MHIKELLGEIFIDLPNEYHSYFELGEKITSVSLSNLGNIMAIGLNNGEIVICDSETGNNRRNYQLHKASITSISFSIENYHIITGDSEGVIKVIETLSGKSIFSQKLSASIAKVCFSPHLGSECLVHMTNNDVFIIDYHDGNIRNFPMKVSDIIWSKKYSFIAISESNNIEVFNSSFDLIKCNDIQSKKRVIYLKLSNNEKLLITIDIRGDSYLYDTDDLITGNEIECRNVFRDLTRDDKWTKAVFDRNDEHVIFSSNKKQFCKLVIFEIDGTEMKLELEGPSEPVEHLIFHTNHPVIYTAGSAFIRMWTPNYMQSWEQFYPGFEHVENNVDYYEKENEFDFVENEFNTTIPIIPGEKIDIFSSESYDRSILEYLPLLL